MTASSSLIYSDHVASQPSTTSFYPSLAESDCSDDESCSRLPKVSALTDEEDENGSPPSLHLNNLLLLTSRASQQKKRPTSIPSSRFPVIEEDLHSLSRQITTVEECHWRELHANKPKPKTIHITPKKNSTPKIVAPKNLDGACDCTSLAWATLRNRPSTASSSKKLRTNKRLSLGVDDDSYRPKTSTNLLLPASPGESTSTDSGIALSVSSSGSSRSDSTSSSGLMTRLGEEGLPPPPMSGRNKRRRRMALRLLLGNVVRKWFDMPKKSVSLLQEIIEKEEVGLEEHGDVHQAKNELNGTGNTPKWRGDDLNEASPMAGKDINGSYGSRNPIKTNATNKTSQGRLLNSDLPVNANGTSSPRQFIHQELNISPANKRSEFDEPAVAHTNGATDSKNGIAGPTVSRLDRFHNNSNGDMKNMAAPQPSNITKNQLETKHSQYSNIKKPKSAFANGTSPNKANTLLTSQTKESETPSTTKHHIAGKLANMPRFHFPGGKPVSKMENDAIKERVKQLFDSRPGSVVKEGQGMEEVCRKINFPVYSKKAVFDACCRLNGIPSSSPSANINNNGQDSGISGTMSLNFAQFITYWNKMTSRCHDVASRFIFTLAAARAGHKATGDYITKEDFLPMLMDLIYTHPGLHFLRDAPQFHSKYCEVVVLRIFWSVNRSWTGQITVEELRKSNFLETLNSLEDVTDINKITDYFSYEHFYVTYCKFWEIDTDHDMVISREDMRQHCNGALTDRIIDRIFSAAVIRTPPEQKTHWGPGPVRQQPIETIGFEDFVAFLLAEEDKRHPTSIEYWFRCVDLDGDGVISLYEMEYFYAEVEQKLLQKNMETLALKDVICNLLDSVSPANPNYVTRSDLKRSGLAHRFFNTFVNYLKYLEQESSEGERASVKTAGDKEMSDWETFCAVEYELLMSETDVSTDGYGDDNIDVILDDEEQDVEELDALDPASHYISAPVAANATRTALNTVIS